MSRTAPIAFLLTLAAAVSLGSPVRAQGGESEGKKPEKSPEGPLDFEVESIDGKKVDLEKYRGRAIILVNVASECGLTDRQYTGLEALYEKHAKDGLVVLAFPANNFARQEPGTNLQISQFCEKRGVTFPLFAKISVKGEDKHALYRFLTGKETNGEYAGEIEWNFQKFLVHPKGHVVARFSPRENPMGEKVLDHVKKALADVPDEVRAKARAEAKERAEEAKKKAAEKKKKKKAEA